MEPATHIHHMGNFIPASRVHISAIRNEARNLPAPLGIFEDKGTVKSDFLRNLLRSHLALAVNQELRADARMPVHILTRVGCKVAGQVGKALLQWIDIANLTTVAPEYLHDVVKDFRVHVLDEMGIKIPELIERVKLIDDARGILSERHIQLVDMLDIELFPQLVGSLWPIVFLLKDLNESL